MAVIVFLVLVGLVVVVWLGVTFLRGSKEVVDEGTQAGAGHKFPAETGDAPTLLEDDLSFSNRTASDQRERTD